MEGPGSKSQSRPARIIERFSNSLIDVMSDIPQHHGNSRWGMTTKVEKKKICIGITLNIFVQVFGVNSVFNPIFFFFSLQKKKKNESAGAEAQSDSPRIST